MPVCLKQQLLHLAETSNQHDFPMFGLSKKEKQAKKQTAIAETAVWLSRELRDLLVKLHPEAEVLIDTVPDSVSTINIIAVAITEFFWELHLGIAPGIEETKRLILTVTRHGILYGRSDEPSQEETKQLLYKHMWMGMDHKELLRRIIICKEEKLIDTMYSLLENNAIEEREDEGAISQTDAAQHLLNLIRDTMARMRKIL